MVELSRRQILKSGAAFGLLVASGGLVAACAGAAQQSGAASGGQTAETTFQRAKRLKSIKIAAVAEPPFSIATPGKVSGIDPEIFRAFMASQGVDTIEGVEMEFASLIPALVAGRIDAIASGMIIRPARCEQIVFANPSIQILEAFAVKKGNPLNLHSYKDIGSSPTARIGAARGGVEIEFAGVAGVPADRIVEFPDFQTAISGLQAGRIDVEANNSLAIADILKRVNDPNLEMVQLTDQPVDKAGKSAINYIGFGFRKEDTDFLEAANAWLKDALSNGKVLEVTSTFGITKEMIPPAGLTSEKICKG